MSITDGARSHTTADRSTTRPPRASTHVGARGAALSHALAVGTFTTKASPGSWVKNFASQDWLTVGYLVVLLGALVLGKGPNRDACLIRVSADLGVFLFIIALVRGQVLRWGGVASSLIYRTAVIGAMLSSFFQLREILPAVSPWTDDARIYAFDLHVFGFEPSIVFDRYVAPATTEWFAFFYFLYFLILSVHILPMVYWQRDTHLLGRFGTGLLLIFCVAHVAYMIVPGFGPYWYLKDAFHHQLQGATFWRLVREAVEAGGAQKDIFPSLHTAVPTYFAIFSFRHRRLLPFKLWWPAIAFLATQIIIATMFLRWHYLIDVVAGVTLAVAGSLLGQHIANWERAKRERLGLQPVWTPLAYPWSRAVDD
ncbi:MAG: phosphatase PAP2 family protein [Myxococcota bacterium]|nr:phosphatase PAP2 family protein [Myxococcota bacterium]